MMATVPIASYSSNANIKEIDNALEKMKVKLVLDLDGIPSILKLMKEKYQTLVN